MSQKHLGAHPKCLGNGWLAAQNVQRHFWNAPGYFENASRTIPGPKKRPNGALASPPPPCGVFGGLENVLEAFSKCPRSLKKCFWTFWVAPQPFPGHRSARIFLVIFIGARRELPRDILKICWSDFPNPGLYGVLLFTLQGSISNRCSRSG